MVALAKATAVGAIFPAFFGPNFDWTPNQDHAGVLMCALQSMALQAEVERVLRGAAWPAGWHAQVRLHTPHGRVEEFAL